MSILSGPGGSRSPRGRSRQSWTHQALVSLPARSSTPGGELARRGLLALGLLDRFTGLVDLPAGWTWLSADASLWILGALLALELVADKIPGVDAVNDVVQTVVGADTVTVGAAAPVLSAAEDVSAAGLVAAALFLPVLVAVLVVAVVVGLLLLARRFRDRRTRGRAAAVPGGPEWTA